MGKGAYQNPDVFTSWKEIAAYLGSGVRTVQRWEVKLGLPIQRPNAHRSGIVRASREELDKWVATRWSALPAQLTSENVVLKRELEEMRREEK